MNNHNANELAVQGIAMQGVPVVGTEPTKVATKIISKEEKLLVTSLERKLQSVKQIVKNKYSVLREGELIDDTPYDHYIYELEEAMSNAKSSMLSLEDYNWLYDDEIIEELMDTPYLESYLSEIEEAIGRLMFTSDGEDYLPAVILYRI